MGRNTRSGTEPSSTWMRSAADASELLVRAPARAVTPRPRDRRAVVRRGGGRAGARRAERGRGPSRVGRPVRVPAGCGGDPRRRVPVPGARRSRSSRTRRDTCIRLSSCFALVPLTPLPVPVASALVAVAMLALVGLTLYVVGVRDARCYAAALLWVPAISGVLLSNVSIPLAFALAVLWRYRDAIWPPAAALGLAVSAKLLLWPMYVWMLATRRLRAAALSLAIGLAVTAGRMGGDRIRRARRLPGPAAAAVGDPVRAELLVRRDRGGARSPERGRPGPHARDRARSARALRRRTRGAATKCARSPALSQRRSR